MDWTAIDSQAVRSILDRRGVIWNLGPEFEIRITLEGQRLLWAPMVWLNWLIGVSTYKLRFPLLTQPYTNQATINPVQELCGIMVKCDFWVYIGDLKDYKRTFTGSRNSTLTIYFHLLHYFSVVTGQDSSLQSCTVHTQVLKSPQRTYVYSVFVQQYTSNIIVHSSP